MSKIFRRRVKATTVSVQSGAPCCNSDQSRPCTTAMGAHDPTPLHAAADIAKRQNKPALFHKFTRIVQKTSTSPPRTEVYNQFGYRQLPLKLTSLLISHIKMSLSLGEGDVTGYFLTLRQVTLLFLGQPCRCR